MQGNKRAGRIRQGEGHHSEELVMPGDPDGVRDGLRSIFARPMLARLDEESRGTVQIVLAEVLNNIAEHAYARYPGDIELSITAHDDFLFLRTRDRGLPMPGGELPAGKLTEATEIQDLPEGGFGWFLIRSLTQELSYQRLDSLNVLSFCIGVDYPG